MSKYEVSIKENSDIGKLIRALASRKREEFDAATEAVAAFIQVVALEVIAQAPTVGNFFKTITYEKGTAPYIPLDTYYDVRDRNYIQVWSQSMPGGLATNFVKGLARMVADTYSLETAASMFKEDAAGGRVDILAATIERMAQELLIAHDTNSASVISAALGQSLYTPVGGGTQIPQGIRTNNANQFGMDDFNRVITLLQRIRPSWVGGTPVGGNTISHLVGSPEFMEQVRSIAYQPQNTRAVPDTNESTVLAAPDSVREAVFNAAGNPSFYGVELVNLYEMGVGQPYNTLFANYIGSTNVGGSAFTAASDEVVWALNLNVNKNALIRIVERGVDDGSTLNVMPDDSFPMRSEKVGWWARQKEGRVITDSRSLGFLIM